MYIYIYICVCVGEEELIQEEAMQLNYIRTREWGKKKKVKTETETETETKDNNPHYGFGPCKRQLLATRLPE